jgi:transcriptional regulator with XRE-family HTH domain
MAEPTENLDENQEDPSLSLAGKIKWLVAERGWNQEEFARRAGLNRQTARQIMTGGGRTLRNSTISACANALGLSVNDLRMLPLEKLLPKMTNQGATGVASSASALRERATQPELIAWTDRNQERANELTPDEIEELLGLQQDDGGVLAEYGVERFVAMIERRRRLIEQVQTIAGTEHLDLLEGFVNVLYKDIQPYRDRTEKS